MFKVSKHVGIAGCRDQLIAMAKHCFGEGTTQAIGAARNQPGFNHQILPHKL
jgi:hypothetical protein